MHKKGNLIVLNYIIDKNTFDNKLFSSKLHYYLNI